MKIVPQIRSRARSDWAEIVGVELTRDDFFTGGAQWGNARPCYKIMLEDGRTALWPIYEENPGYEFRSYVVAES